MNYSVQYITETFQQRRAARQRSYAAYLQTIPHYIVYAQYRGRPPLHPHILATLQRQIADANAELRRDIDADWKACVMRYPEVLTHFYSMVSVRLPAEAPPPQLKGLSGAAPPAPPPPSPSPGYGLGVLPDPLPVRGSGGLGLGSGGLGVGGGGGGGGSTAGGGAIPPPPSAPPLSRTASKRSNSAAAKRRSMPPAMGSIEREKELERDLAAAAADLLYPRGAERKKGGGLGGGGGGLAGMGIPPPPPPAPEVGPRERERGRRRRDSAGYTTISGRNPVPGVPPNVPMPPGYWPFSH